MGKIFLPKWNDDKPPQRGRKKRLAPKVVKKEYWGYGHYLLTYSNKVKELNINNDPIRLLFYKAKGWDEDGQPILTDES